MWNSKRNRIVFSARSFPPAPQTSSGLQLTHIGLWPTALTVMRENWTAKSKIRRAQLPHNARPKQTFCRRTVGSERCCEGRSCHITCVLAPTKCSHLQENSRGSPSLLHTEHAKHRFFPALLDRARVRAGVSCSVLLCPYFYQNTIRT